MGEHLSVPRKAGFNWLGKLYLAASLLFIVLRFGTTLAEKKIPRMLDPLLLWGIALFWIGIFTKDRPRLARHPVAIMILNITWIGLIASIVLLVAEHTK